MIKLLYILTNSNLFVSNLFIEILLYINTILLSVLKLYIANKSLFSNKINNYFKYNSTLEYLTLLLIISGLILFILNALFIIVSYLNMHLKLDILNMSSNNTVLETLILCFVRWWPSGTTQSWACLGAAVAVYRTIPGDRRVKTIAGIASLGLSIGMSIYSQAVENPNGFNQLMYSYYKFKKTGIWPSIRETDIIEDRKLDKIMSKTLEESRDKLSDMTNNNQLTSSDIGNNISDFINDNLNSIIEDKYIKQLRKNNNLTSSFMLPLILSKLDITVTDNHSSLTQMSYGVFLISLVALFCLINIIGYMIVNIIINKVDYEKRYPRLSKIINYYRKMSLIYVGIDIILCLICLLLLVFFSLSIIYIGIVNN